MDRFDRPRRGSINGEVKMRRRGVTSVAGQRYSLASDYSLPDVNNRTVLS
jgi:hypothetical protein